MATISVTAEELQGRQLLDETGREIGGISDLYVDDDGRPHWLLVDTSFFPGFFSVIPVTDVVVSGRGLEVHYNMEKLTGAPNSRSSTPVRASAPSGARPWTAASRTAGLHRPGRRCLALRRPGGS